jgi:hypothetical protein
MATDDFNQFLSSLVARKRAGLSDVYRMKYGDLTAKPSNAELAFDILSPGLNVNTEFREVCSVEHGYGCLSDKINRHMDAGMCVLMQSSCGDSGKNDYEWYLFVPSASASASRIHIISDSNSQVMEISRQAIYGFNDLFSAGFCKDGHAVLFSQFFPGATSILSALSLAEKGRRYMANRETIDAWSAKILAEKAATHSHTL